MSPVVYPLTVNILYKNSLGLRSGVVVVSVFLGYEDVEFGSAFTLEGLKFHKNLYKFCENHSTEKNSLNMVMSCKHGDFLSPSVTFST